MMHMQSIGKRLNFLFLALVLIPFLGIGQNAETPYRIKTIVIDAGHGGKDPGNLGTGRYKAQEKDIALEVALLVGGYIVKQFPEIKVLYTRSTDVFIGLDQRAEMANEAKADLFLSIHCNAFPNPNSNGVETFVLGLHRNKENLQVAMKENSAIFLEDDYKTKYEGFDPNSAESIIALTIMQSAYLQQSLTISSYVQNQFKNRVGRKDRGVKQAGFLVLRKTTMPSILVELGFLTHAPEEDFLNSENGKSYMSSAIFRGFKEYKEMVEDPLPEGAVEPMITDEDASINKAQAAAQAELDAKMKAVEKEKQDSIHKVLDQAQNKAKADSLEQLKQQLFEEKKQREDELAKKAEEAKKAKIQTKIDSLEQVKKEKIAAFEKQKAEIAAQKEQEAKSTEEARVAQEEKQKKELEAKQEAKEWLEEIKEVKEQELADAKHQAEIDAEKKKLEALKQQKLQELADAKAKAETLEKARADSLATSQMIKEQLRIDSVARDKREQEQVRLDSISQAEQALKAAAIKEIQPVEIVNDSIDLLSAAEEKIIERRRKLVVDSLAKVAEREQLVKDSVLVVEADMASKIAREKARQDSISDARRVKRQTETVTIDAQKAASAEEAELLFLQLRKKQLEQRINQLKKQNVEPSTRESLVGKPVEVKKDIESQPVLVVNEPAESGIVLKVQVVSSSKQIAKNSNQFKGKEVWEYQQGGLYKYTVGATDDFEEITKLQSELRDLGFKGAFVVAFKDGERIKVSEARGLLNMTE